ncbi:creatine kinase M-type isoform X2 [Denticeps clupeoides]|uniref:creatine kinase M-type isoform X2 n=1 Tax=Denticeps clupeoides TaxID=299321 RepID=UPI0010A42DD7|nr:creatine kinase M-type-like isoform X2 [Denticeps clupeoides]
MGAPLEYALEKKYKPILENMLPRDPMSCFNLKRGSPKEEFPCLDGNYTCMGRILTLQMYSRQFNRATESGVIFDDIIRPGLENPGSSAGSVSVGCAAGDAQSYILFCDFFDRIIEAYHDHKMSRTQESDFNYDNLKGGDDFDSMYAISCEVSVSRAVEDFSFPMHCSRGERRKLLSLAKQVLSELAKDFPGSLTNLAELTQHCEERFLYQQVPPIELIKTAVGRDWPDARARWVSNDGSLVVWINTEDHLRLLSSRTDANIQEAFKCICVNLVKLEAFYKKWRHPFVWKEHLGWVVSSPAEVGTGLKASVIVRLSHIPQNKRIHDILERLRLHLHPTAKAGLYRVSNAPTIGFTEVGLVQLLVDGVKLLIRIEKRLENEGGIDDLVPAHKYSMDTVTLLKA